MPASPRLRAGAWAAAAGLALGAVGAVVLSMDARVQAAARRQSAQSEAAGAALALEQRISRSLSAAYALAAIIRQHERIDGFDKLAAEMIQTYGGIGSLQLAPGGVVRQIYPPDTGVVGHDILQDPERRVEANETIRSRRLTLAGPFALRQGGVGMVGRYPVFVHDGEAERFWGFANVLLTLPDVLSASHVHRLSGDGWAWALTRVPAGGGPTEQVAGAGHVGSAPVRVVVEVPNGAWTLAVTPVAGWHDVRRTGVGAAVVALFALLGAAFAYRIAREPERLRVVVEERTAELARAYAQLEADSAERHRAEERLRQAQKMEAVGQLAGGVAHDFNNLLTGILGCAAEIADVSPPGTAARDAADTITEAANRAAELTRQLLGFARRGKLLAAPVDLHAAAGEVVRLLRRTVDERVAIATVLAAPRATVIGDSGQLQHAILNLAVNARDAMPTGGRLVIETSVVTRDASSLRRHPGASPGAFAALTVSDTGRGVPSSIQDRIFEPFFTTKEPGRGTGMGLAMVYGVATHHGGFVELESEEGRGARFTLFLPLHDATAEAPAAEAPAPRTGTGRVLVVDDEGVVRAAATRLLARLGYDAAEAASGADAVEYVRARPGQVSLAIVDIGMPGMDGLATLRALHAIDPAVSVIVSSGYGRDGRAQELLDAGALEFLQKPWSLAELGDVVARAASARAGAGR